MTRFKIPLPAWLALACFVWRLSGLFLLADSPFLFPESGDMRFYANWAIRILDGEWTDGRAFYALPGYPWLLAGLFAIGGINPFLPGLLQIVADSLLAGLLAQFALTLCAHQPRWFARTAAVTTALLWIVFLPAAAFSIIMMPTALIVMAYWWIIRWASIPRLPTWKSWPVLGLLIGFLGMFIATLFGSILLLVAAAWRDVWRQTDDARRRWPLALRHALCALALLVVGALVGCSPAWIHNHFIAKDPVFLTAHSGLNLYVGNNPIATGYPDIPPGMFADQEGMLLDSITIAEQALGRPLKRSEVSEYWASQARAWIRENRADWLRLQAAKLQNFWSGFVYDDISVIQNFVDHGILRPGIGWGTLVTFAGAGLVAACLLRLPSTGWVVAGILLHLATLLPVFVTERYRMAAAPGLAILAGVGITALAVAIATRRGRASLFLLLGAVGGLVLATVASPPQKAWSVVAYNSGIAALKHGHLALARQRLEASLARSPHHHEVILALGNYHMEKGDAARAQTLYLLAYRIEPRNHRATNNIAVLLIAENRWAEAEPFLKHAVTGDPTDAKRWFLLAQLELALERPATALIAVRQAIRHNPRVELFRVFEQSLIADHPEVSE